MASSSIVLSIFVAICIASTVGHSYVTSPITRSNQMQTKTGCRGPNCLGPCEVPLSQARTPAVTIARGASINVQWPRNNHAGGFIRLAWAPTASSDEHAQFDSNVQEIVCHESGGCHPDDPSNPNGGDSGPADGSSRACQTSITVPLHLTDGTWTLQWAWFGGAFALGDYYSCVDYKIQGGPVASKLDAVFIGGDYTYPGQNKCKFFNTDRLHQCTVEPCDKPLYSLNQEQAGKAYLPSTTPSIPISITSGKLTTGVKVNTPATTGTVVPATATTAKAASVPTSTTGKVSNNSPKNCAGLTNVVTSTKFEVDSVDTWSNVFRMSFRVKVNEPVSDWMIQVVWPDNAINTEVEAVFNAGDLQCSGTQPTRHSMIAPEKWSNSLKSGEEVYIELRATNTNMNSNFLKANTKFTMYRK